MSDKGKYIKKILTQKRKEKLGINQQNRCQASERVSLLNQTKVRITTKGKGSINMHLKKVGITMNITMASSLALRARKHLCFFVSKAREKSKLGIIIIIGQSTFSKRKL